MSDGYRYFEDFTAHDVGARLAANFYNGIVLLDLEQCSAFFSILERFHIRQAGARLAVIGYEQNLYTIADLELPGRFLADSPERDSAQFSLVPDILNALSFATRAPALLFGHSAAGAARRLASGEPFQPQNSELDWQSVN